MPISGQDLVNMSLEELARLFKAPNCKCGKSIEEHPDEQYVIAGKVVCSDCYYKSLGDFIEKNPIYFRPGLNKV